MMNATAMPSTELRLRLDERLLAKARAVAEQQNSSVEDLLVVYLTRLVAREKRRRLTRAMMKPYVDRPTLSLSGPSGLSQDDEDG